MRTHRHAVAAVLVAGGGAVVTSVLLAVLPPPLGVGAIGLVLCWIGFSVWPWAVLPVGILGGTIGAALSGHGDVRGVVLAHVLALVAGCVALVTRRLVGCTPGPRLPGRYRFGITLMLATVAVGALYGLAAGNTAKDVAVAVYQVAVIPVYFLVAIRTLDTARGRRRAAILYVATIAALTALELTTPGRHGGLLSLLAVPILVVAAGRSSGWRRAGLAVVAAGLSADVLLASYRGVWIAGGIAVASLVARGGADIRRGLVATAMAGAALVTILALGVGYSGGLVGRFSVVGEALGRDAGYRVPEAKVGLDVFAARPLVGAGLGQSSPRTYIPGFTVIDVGPVYHSFYIVLLANLGLLGALVVLWPIGRSVWDAVVAGDSVPLALAALTCGFLAAAVVSGPTDGHWELGLLPALTVLTLAPDPPSPRPTRRPDRADRLAGVRR